MTRMEGKIPTKILWIFCEGKTEKLYFDKLRSEERVSRLKIKPVQSEHKNADGIVQEAVDILNKKGDFQKDDLIACVFDRDSNSNKQLKKAEQIAQTNGIIVTFSNPCFEYWILCHYGYFVSSYEQEHIITEIRRLFNCYTKNDPELYSKTKDKIHDAIANAKKVKNKHVRGGCTLISRESNPLTLVFELIQKIDSFRDKKGFALIFFLIVITRVDSLYVFFLYMMNSAYVL